VSGGRLGMKTRRCSNLPGQRRRAASDRGSDAALKHGGRNGGEAGEASGWAVGAARGVRRWTASNTRAAVARLGHGRRGSAAQRRETSL
jgi:hypothetical protein